MGTSSNEGIRKERMLLERGTGQRRRGWRIRQSFRLPPPARSDTDGPNGDGARLLYRKQGRLATVPVVKSLAEKTTWSPCRLSCRRLGPSCHGAGSFPGTS